MKDSDRKILWKKLLPNLILVCVGVVLFILLFNFKQVWSSILWFVKLFAPFLGGLVLAYLLNIPLVFLENRFLKKVKYRRVISILIVYSLALALLMLAVRLLLPEVINSLRTLMQNIPAYLNNMQNLGQWLSDTYDIAPENLDFIMVSYQDVVTRLMNLLRSSLPSVLNWTFQFGSGIISVLTGFIASIYMLASKEKLLFQMRKVAYAFLPAPKADRVYYVADLSNRVFSGFISGKILDSAIIGIICFVFLFVANFFIPMPFILLISVVIGVTNIIPFFGPFIGAVPCAMILLMVNPLSALVFVIFIILLQQLDGNVIGPKILGDSTGLPALWVLVAIIIGGGIWGIWGILLGVPAAAVLYTLSSDYIHKRLARGGIDQETLAQPKNTQP